MPDRGTAVLARWVARSTPPRSSSCLAARTGNTNSTLERGPVQHLRSDNRGATLTSRRQLVSGPTRPVCCPQPWPPNRGGWKAANTSGVFGSTHLITAQLATATSGSRVYATSACTAPRGHYDSATMGRLSDLARSPMTHRLIHHER